MSQPAFEMRCPSCGSVVSHEAAGCENCGGPARKVAAVEAEPVHAPTDTALTTNMSMKDYHRLVRTNHRTVEGARVANRGRGRLAAYLPFVLLLIGLIVGAGFVLGKF